MKGQATKVLIFSIFVLYILSFFSNVHAQSEEEKKFLLMYFKEEELVVVSATRSLKSITQTAENVSVITKDDIELLNAHTLADVLNTVNGVQIASTGVNNEAYVSIQASEQRHVAVFMDGIPLNNLSNFIAEVGSIPVEHIEKIEIIKGPASSAWGSSLGGVINIITKSPGGNEKVSGKLSASYGEEDTGDFRAKISGKKGKFGYYLTAGRQQTDGFRPVSDVEGNNLFTKFTFDISDKTDILFSMLYGKTSRGRWQDIEFDEFGRQRFERLHSGVSLNTRLDSALTLNFSVFSTILNENDYTYQISTGSEIDSFSVKDRVFGGSTRLQWKRSPNNIVLGIDYDSGTLESTIIKDDKQSITKWAVYANDTITFGKFSVTPGLRYDNTDSNGDFISPSIGVTYGLSKNTILRIYTARGFNIPPLIYTYFKDQDWWRGNPDLEVEEVTSYQAGIETGEMKYFWFKLTAFRHDIKQGIIAEDIDPDPDNVIYMYVNKDRIRKQGFEAEIKTVPFYNITLSAGAAYIKSKNILTGEEITSNPKYVYNVGIHYDDKKSFKAVLLGNYTWWVYDDIHKPRTQSFIVDINLVKSFYKQSSRTIEAFLTAHNIFDVEQYWDSWYKNAPRWFEGGIRYRF